MEKRSPALQTQATSWPADSDLFALVIGGPREPRTLDIFSSKMSIGKPEPVRQYLLSEIESLKDRIASEGSVEDVEDVDNFLQLQAQEFQASADSAAMALQHTLNQIDSGHTSFALARSQSRTSRHLLFRLELLQQHYRSDMRRLAAVNESAFLIAQLTPVPCPTCGHSIEAKAGDEDFDWSQEKVGEVSVAAQAEMQKIQLLESDLAKVIDRTRQEGQESERNEGRLKEAVASLRSNAETQKRQVSEVREKLSSAFATLTRLAEKRALANRMNELVSQLHVEIPDAVESSVANRVDTSGGEPTSDPEALSGFCEAVRKLLVVWKWNYTPAPIEVSFDSKTTGIVISGSAHRSFGKAARALLSSAFVVGLMDFCFENELPHPGFVVLDSPLTTKKERGSVDEELSDATLFAFFDHLSGYSDRQVVIFDNKEPPESISSKINHVRFGDRPTDNRKGLVPETL